LDKPELAPGFLLHGHPAFGGELRTCAALAAQAPGGAARSLLMDRIDRAVEPFDIAGLLDRSRRDWYPVLAQDLLANAGKLHATIDEVETLLRRSGFPGVSPAPVDPISPNDGAVGARGGVQRPTT
jgi:FADH2 O2-dependent halogenase